MRVGGWTIWARAISSISPWDISIALGEEEEDGRGSLPFSESWAMMAGVDVPLEVVVVALSATSPGMLTIVVLVLWSMP